MGVYADNASTSFPKPLSVAKAITEYITEIGASPSRGSYRAAVKAQELLLSAREGMAEMLCAPSPKNIIFNQSATLSLNMLIKGLCRENSHFVTTSMEHNAVMRTLSQSGASFTAVDAEPDGTVQAEKIEKAITKSTVAVITTHASNVCGTVLPAEEIYTICKKYDIFYILDAAQTCGVLPITLKNADAIAFAGHKGLLGPQGTGGFAVSSKLAERLKTVYEGGTGSLSHEEQMPTRLPDKFEPGTHNMPGICGLSAGVEFLRALSAGEVYKHEQMLCEKLLQGLMNINGITVYGLKTSAGRVCVVPIAFKSCDNAHAAHMLDTQYNIQTRCGLHCAPRAHKTLGSCETGAVRISLGFFNTINDVNEILNAVSRIAE